MINSILFFCLVVLTNSIYASEVVKTCLLNNASKTTVELSRDSKIGDSFIYYWRTNDDGQNFLFDDTDLSRGSEVRSYCIKDELRALIISGEFSSNYLQGIVFTYNFKTHHIDKFRFAERSRPEWLYLSKKMTLLIFSTHSHGETNKKYLIYKKINDIDDEPEIIDTNHLPPTKNFNVTRLHQ